jgi:hypothetical protein
MTPTIDYGDDVRIAAEAPERYYPGARASACGFRVVASERESKAAGEPVGTPLWLVEFSDGSAREVPAHYLTRINDP